MGMAASQARFLQLTERKNQIGLELSRLSNQKVSLANDTQRISRELQEALNAKVLKWSNNAGVSYIDLTYNNLMHPSTMNQNTPYLLTDLEDRVVVDAQYQKYAEIISANGAGGGDWESNRTKILAELTGIDPNKIENANYYQEEIWANEAVLNSLIDEKIEKPTKKGNAASFATNLGSATGTSARFSDGSSWAEAYSKGGTISLGATASATGSLKNITDYIAKTLGAYVDDPQNMQTACDNFYNSYVGYIGDSSDGTTQLLNNETSPLRGDANNYTINVEKMINNILGAYAQATGSCDVDCNGNTVYEWNDINSTTYQKWAEQNKLWESAYNDAKQDYDEAVSANNTLFTAEEEGLINFYDTLFSTIAEKGWTYNNQVTDTEYLNQMLQNNYYRITTVEREAEYDNKTGEYDWDNDYETDIASNFTNIFAVNDSDAREEALAEYEYEKSIINEKETRIDTRMENLKTEQAAIQQMLEGLQSVIKDNNDRTMNSMA